MNLPVTNYNIGATILKRAEMDPSKTALIFEGEEWSYLQFAQRVRCLAAGLKERGLQPGDRLAYLGFNHIYYFELLLAAHCVGAIFVPLNYRLTAAELDYIINDASPRILVADAHFSEAITSILDHLNCDHYFCFAGLQDGNAVCSESCKTGPFERYATLFDHGQDVADYESEQHDAAIIMYTSGTTGKPKGAVLSHGNLLWNNVQANFSYSVVGDDISLVCAPLFHIGGLNVTTLCTLMNGGALLVHRQFDPGKILEDIPQYRVTTMFAAPAMLQFMAQEAAFNREAMASLRMIVVGAAPIAKSLLELFLQHDIEINQGYGLTETSPMVSFLTAHYTTQKLGSAGKPGIFGAVKVIAPDGTENAKGEVGEILYRGPNVMLGYWGKPEETAKAIDSDGWFHTGDAGYLDEDGFIFISDRIKDMVITGGENVYPAEVESVLYGHPAIAEVAIIGLPHEKWGEAVTAIVVLKPEHALRLEELRQFAEKTLARYKLPLAMHQVESLPRNPAGKVLKHELRNIANERGW